MNGLEDLVRETLAARAHDVDGVTLTVSTPRPRRTRRWVAVGTVAALAAAMVVAVVLIAPWRTAIHRTATPADTTTAATLPTPPSGTQWVSFRGITLTVPSAWAVGSYDCDSSSAPGLVDIALANPACAVRRPDGQTVVRLTPLGTMPPQGEVTTVAGRPAWQDTRTQGGPTSSAQFTIQLRDVGVLMDVRLPAGDTAGPGRLLAALEYTPVDHLGCAAEFPGLTDTLGYHGAAITTSDVVSGVVCDYVTDGFGLPMLLASRILDTSDLARLSAVVRTAVPAAPTDGTGEPRERLVYRLHDAGGRGLVLNAVLGTSTTFYDNRERWARLDDAAPALPTRFS